MHRTGAQRLILDDLGLEPLDAGARLNIYEIPEELYGLHSLTLTSQILVGKGHEVIGNPTYTHTTLNRLF